MNASDVKISHRRADQATADACRELLEVVQREAAHWNLELPQLRVYVIRRWTGIYRALLPAHLAICILLFPLFWWNYRKYNHWKDTYGMVFRYGKRVLVFVKSQAVLPADPQPILYASWSRLRELSGDRGVWWKLFVAGNFAEACCPLARLPAWVVVALQSPICAPFRPWPREDPDDLMPIMRAMCAPPPRIKTKRAEDLTREETDDLIAARTWQIYLLKYVDETYPGYLAQLIKEAENPQDFNQRLGERLGLPPGPEYWRELARRILVQHGQDPGEFTTQQPATEPRLPRDLSAGEVNPFQAPGSAAAPAADEPQSPVRMSRTKLTILMIAVFVSVTMLFDEFPAWPVLLVMAVVAFLILLQWFAEQNSAR